MNRKFLYVIILFVAIILLSTSFTFAVTKPAMENAANGIRNVVGSAENTIENAAAGVANTSKNVTGDIEKSSNTMTNNTSTYMSTNGNSGTGYTSTRTSTDITGDTTFLGMNSTAWIWLILAIAAVAIVALVYYYSAQTRDFGYDHNSEE